MIVSISDVTATTGQKVPLSSISVLASWIQIQSSIGNSDTRVGDANIGSGRGAIIVGGGSQFFPIAGSSYDLSSIFLLGTTGNIFEVLYDTSVSQCAKFKLYSSSIIEFIGFGEDQIQSFNLVQVDEEMMLPVTEPRVGMWNLTAAGETEG